MTAHRFSFLLLPLLALGCSGPAAGPAPSEKAARAERIDAFLADRIDELGIPGIAFALVEGDRVTHFGTAGFRNVEERLPVTPDTLFPIGSCTKAFTATALVLAEDRRELSLDDSPRLFLPWFRMADSDADARVTLRDLLAHRSGLAAKADLAATPGVLSREEYARTATSAKPVAPLGAEFHYSNAAYTAAGLALGSVEKSSWEQVIQKRIFAPLGMTASLTTLDRLADSPDAAVGYDPLPGPARWRAVPPPSSFDALAPAGSIASSARDLGQWVRMLAGSGSIDGWRFVSERGFRELTTGITPIDANRSYALGWVTYDWNGHRVVEHNGGASGISALVSFIPERQVGFVLLANASPTDLTRVGRAEEELWPLLLGEPAKDPVAAAPPKKGAPAAQQLDPGLPKPRELVERMIGAAGGRATLERHRSLELRGRKSYENQGVAAEVTIRSAAPARREEEERWTAIGRGIGRVRSWFDGREGGQETTFGQDATNDEATNASARREQDFRPILHLFDLYEEVAVTGLDSIGGEEAVLLRLRTATGADVKWWVSSTSARLLRSESAGTTIDFADHRLVDGETIPFLLTIHDPLGESVLRVTYAKFDVAFPPSSFAPSPSPGD